MRCIFLRRSLQTPLPDQLKFRCHHYTPQQIGEPIGRGFLRLGGIAQRRLRHTAFRGCWRAAQRVPVNPLHRFANSLEGGIGRQGRLRIRRHQPVHRGLAVEDKETGLHRLALRERGASWPGAALKRVNPLPAISYTTTEESFTRRAGTSPSVIPEMLIAEVSSRSPERSSGFNAESGVTPFGPTNSGCTQRGAALSGAVESES